MSLSTRPLLCQNDHVTILILFTIFGIIALAELRGRANKNPDLRKWAMIGVFLFFAGEATLIYFTFVQPSLERQALHDNGVSHPATIVGVKQTGNYHNRNPEVELTVEVRPDKQDKYKAQKTLIMKQVTIAKFTEGTEVTVLVDPSDRETFLIKELE